MRVSASCLGRLGAADAPAPPRSSVNDATQTMASQTADARVEITCSCWWAGMIVLWRRARVDRCPQLLREAKVVTVVPDLHDLAVTNAEDVDARERCVLTGGRHPTPWTGVGPRCGPPAGDQVALGQQQVDVPAQVGEGGSERRGDLLLSLRAWRSRGRT